MSALVTDIPEYVAMSAIAACLCAQIEDDGLPDVCLCSIQPGVVAYDFADCSGGGDGMAWVSPRLLYPSAQFPLITPTWTPCNNSAIKAMQIEVGIVRNAPLTDGQPTDHESWTAMAQQQMLDMSCIRKALTCCSGYDIVLQQWQPIGPAGGVIGGSWLCQVAAEADD